MGLINKFKDSYLGFILKEIKHRITLKKSYDVMEMAMERYKRCNTKKSKRQIRREMRICRKYWRCYPSHYYRYDLYEKDRQLTEKELIDYIPEFFFYRLFLNYYDSNKYDTLISEKNITEQIFRSLDINQPKTLYKLINNNLYDMDMRIKSIVDFREALEANEYSKLFVKPADGKGGDGIFVFHRNGDGSYKTIDGEELTDKFIKEIGKKEDYLIQLAVVQDKRMAEIYPNSVNTFRMATENKEGKVKVLCSTLRIGKNGNEVDNWMKNGIVLGVDIETGRIQEVGMTKSGEKFYSHPDTGFVFKDYEIPEWDKVKAFVIESAGKLAQFTYLGWDIALSEYGPLAIETNLGFGLDHYQTPLGGMREVFSIEDPDFYWRCRGKKQK